MKLIRASTVPISLNNLLKGQLKFLDQHFEVVAVSGQDNHLETVKNREGVRVVPLEMQRQISPVKDLVSLWKLYRLFKKEKPEIVHSITPKAGLLSMVAGYFARVPIRVHTFTGLIFPTRTGHFQKLMIFMDKTLCRFATHIFPEGEGVKKDLLAFGITKKPLQIIANGNVNGLDTYFFSADAYSDAQLEQIRNEFGIPTDAFVFVFIGRLVRDKGINELVAAFRKVSEKNQKVKLLLVGPMEEELDPLLPETVSEIEKNPHIISVGYQTDVRKFYAISNALVFPSYREGFPNVVLQAGAMGLPAIVTDISGCNEIIIENVNGTIIQPRNEKALGDAMEKMLRDPEWAALMAAKSREMIVSRYQQQVVWNALLAEYHKMLSEKK